MTLRERYDVHAFGFDERRERDSAASWAHRPPFYRRMFLHASLPPPLLCRTFGHYPVVAGYGTPGETYPDGTTRVSRWVECRRCEVRPERQGNLDPERWPVLGARYTGLFLPPGDVEFLDIVLDTHRLRRRVEHSSEPFPYYAPGPWPDTRRVELSAEIHVEPVARWLRTWDLGVKVGVGGARESTVSVDLHVGPLSAYLRQRNLFGMRVARRVNFLWSPEVSVRLHRFDGRATLRWNLWNDPTDDLRDRRGRRRYHPAQRGPYGTDLRLRHGYIEPVALLAGRPETSEGVVEEARAVVVLPEGGYDATVRLHRYVQRTRLRTRTWYRVDVEPDRPIPHPGNLDSDFYDGDDAMHSISVGYRGSLLGQAWVLHGVTEAARSVLSTRLRHGGSLDWRPSATG